MTTTFTGLGLSDQLTRALARLDLVEPFPIQSTAIPPALEGRDVLGKAPTGSGKTLAFGLPLLSLVDEASPRRPRALVLAPTRELAEQISSDLRPLGAAVNRRVFAIYGGVGYGPQRSALLEGVAVLVATPGRMEDLIEQRMANLDEVEIVVVDEADRMADMGFLPAVQRILDQTSPTRQTLLFSATLDGEAGALSQRYQTRPVTVVAEPRESDIDAIHHFWRVDRDDRVDLTAKLIGQSGRSIVFTRTKRGADRLVRQLLGCGVSAVSIHGGRSQTQRTRALKAFSSGKAQALVATDVAARGIHVDGVASVIQYDPAGDANDYLHRSGRTARAGASGTVVTLVLADQVRDVRAMQRRLNVQASIEAPQLEHVVGSGPRTGASAGESHRPMRASSGRSRGRSSQARSRSIFVGNLPWTTTEPELEELFAGHGSVERVTIIRHKGSGRSKGFGFVDMTEQHGATAIEALGGALVRGRRLQVRFAR